MMSYYLGKVLRYVCLKIALAFANDGVLLPRNRCCVEKFSVSSSSFDFSCLSCESE